MSTFDEIADELSRTYLAIADELRDGKARLEQTWQNIEAISSMDPGLRKSVDGDLGVASRTLDRLAAAATEAARTLAAYAEAIRSLAGGLSEFDVVSPQAPASEATTPNGYGWRFDWRSGQPRWQPNQVTFGAQGQLITNPDAHIYGLLDTAGPALSVIPLPMPGGNPLALADDLSMFLLKSSIYSNAQGHLQVSTADQVAAGGALIVDRLVPGEHVSEAVVRGLGALGVRETISSAAGWTSKVALEQAAGLDLDWLVHAIIPEGRR